MWDYHHDSEATGWTEGGFSTVLPSDVLRVEDVLYLHVMVNRGLHNVIWTEIWSSRDNGISWQHMGEKAKFPGELHAGLAQCWSWDYEPDDGWVYIVSTGFQRDKGIILRRVRPEDIGDGSKYWNWSCVKGNWELGNEPTLITPVQEKWGELCLRRLQPGKWILGGFFCGRHGADQTEFALGYRVIKSPCADVHSTPIQKPVTGCNWDQEDHALCRVAQLYGGYILPNSRLDVPGGIGLIVSQWNTETDWAYRAMQFRTTLNDTTSTGRERSAPSIQ